MATIDVGKLTFNHKGDYSSSTAYVLNDVVYYNGSAYIAKQSTTNNVPTNATYWNLFVLKGTDTSVLTTQGDVLYHNGSALARLGYGTSGQVLQTNGSGANPSWADASSGKIGQIVNMVKTDTTSINSTSYVDVSGCQISITPTATNSKILLMANFVGKSHQQYYYHRYVRDISGGTSNQVPTGWVGDAAGSRVQSSLGDNYQTGGGDNSTASPVPFWNIDSNHNTTSAITYKLQGRSSGGSYTYYYGRSEGDADSVNNPRAPAIVMVAWEILA